MKPADRQHWLLEYLRKKQAGHDTAVHVDTLDAEFVDAYIEETDAKFLMMPYGAHKCAQLGRDLSELHTRGMLTRAVVSLPTGSRNEGFPNWVWSYHL